MMDHWPFWFGALALAGVALTHWAMLRRMMAVSGRFSALVDLARGHAGAAAPEMSAEEMAAALRTATLEEFGDGATLEAPATTPPPTQALKQGPAAHIAFLMGILIGGLASAALAGALVLTPSIASTEFASIFGTSGVTQALVLAGGGALVGFGTRMAAGCTSGHGLCGVSRMQIGSFAATAAFFGTAVVVSFALGALR